MKGVKRMVNNKRISERELVLPALFLIKLRNGIKTSELIKELGNLLQPTGEDIKILKRRKDTKFSQKVRNLASHKTLDRLGYATYKSLPSDGLFNITEKGSDYLYKNNDILEYLLSNNFAYRDIKNSFTDVETAAEHKKKVLTYDENLMIAEGIKKNRNVTLYTRSKQLRDAAIVYYARKGHIICHACFFDFFNFYGKIGKNYIEIHHIKPVFRCTGENKPIFLKRAVKNVIPTCSNCHRMIHRKLRDPLSLKLLKKHISDNAKR